MITLLPSKTEAPQPVNPAREIEGSQVVIEKPTLLGEAPASLKQHFVNIHPDGTLPEFVKLPSAKERCPITGASRSWILDQEKAGNVKIVRVRRPGRLRGACFVYLPSLIGLLRRELARQNPDHSEVPLEN